VANTLFAAVRHDLEYACVSTDDRGLDSRTVAFTVAGADRVFAETISGSRRGWPEPDKMPEQYVAAML